MSPVATLARACTGVLVGIAGACALPIETKTACVTSIDCADSRVCIAAECTDGACRALCELIDAARSDCPALGTLEAGDCNVVGGDPSIGEGSCRTFWDRLHGPAEVTDTGAAVDCGLADCVVRCPELCTLAVACGLATDNRACVEGCLALRDDCTQPAPTGCLDVPTDVLCYEAHDPDAC